MANPSVCHYGTLARLYVEEDEWTDEEKFGKGCFKTKKTAPYRADKDLLLALGESHLFVLRRKQEQTRSCVCMSPPELTLESSTQQRLASEFQCPHIRLYDDYEQWAAFPYSAIVQVQLTLRTVTTPSEAGKSTIAARTKDLVIVTRDNSRLWVEFEHNLGRGAFLDALMAASAPHVTLDLDYADQAKHNSSEVEEVSSKDAAASTEEPASPRMVFDFQQAASRLAVIFAHEIDADDLDVALYGETEHSTAPLQTLSSIYTSSDQPSLSLSFRREALRKVIETRVQLALQLSNEVELNNPQCHFFLSTAMELSRALDEPDLYALTWLVSGFINLQRALMETPIDSTKLAQSQLEHAIQIAREHSFDVLLSLSLACCGDLHRLSTQRLSLGRMQLIEAAKLMPLGLLDTCSKMQLHNKIHKLGLAMSPRRDRDIQDKNVFDLWKALSTAMSLSRDVNFNSLLRPVLKSSSERSRYCYVDVHTVTGTTNVSTKSSRMCVYFTDQLTFEWLRQEIGQRCNGALVNELEEDNVLATVAEVVGFYAATKKKKEAMISWSTRMVDIVHVNGYILQGVIYERPKPEPPSPPASPHLILQPKRPLIYAVRCFKCYKHMQLNQVEAHSECCVTLS